MVPSFFFSIYCEHMWDMFDLYWFILAFLFLFVYQEALRYEKGLFYNNQVIIYQLRIWLDDILVSQIKAMPLRCEFQKYKQYSKQLTIENNLT